MILDRKLWHGVLNFHTFESMQIHTFLQFGGYTLVRNNSDLFRSFGFDTQPVLIGLIIFQVFFLISKEQYILTKRCNSQVHVEHSRETKTYSKVDFP